MLHTSGPSVVVTIAFLAALSTIAVLCRLFSRFYLVHNGGAESVLSPEDIAEVTELTCATARSDWVIVIALFFAIAMGTGIGMQVRYGLGKPMHELSPEAHTTLLKAFWASIWLYQLAIGFARLAVILQCMRIFPQGAFGPAKWLMGSVLVSMSDGDLIQC